MILLFYVFPMEGVADFYFSKVVILLFYVFKPVAELWR